MQAKYSALAKCPSCFTLLLPRVPVDSHPQAYVAPCTHQVGLVPRVYLDDTTVEIKEPGTTSRVRAIHDYEAKNDDQLSFPLGAVMFVVARVDDAWWKGVYQGKAGLIPASHVQDASKPHGVDAVAASADGAATTSQEEFTGKRCQAIRAHVAQGADELSFLAGDIVFVPKPDDSETWKGVCKSVIGNFPKGKVVDTKEHAKEEIEKMIADYKQTDEYKEAAAALDEEDRKKKEALAAITVERDVLVLPQVTPPSTAEVLASSQPVSSAQGSPPEQSSDVAPAPAAPDAVAAPSGPDPVAEASAATPSKPEPVAAPAKELSDKEKKALAKQEAAEEKKRLKEEAKQQKELEKEKKKAEKEAAKAAKKK